MKIDYGKKGYKIALFAVVLALLAFSIGGTPGQSGTNGTNGTSSILGTLTFALHNVSDVSPYIKMDSIIVADVPKTQRITASIANGDTLISSWISPSMNLTLIPAGAITMHIHSARFDGINHDDRLWFDVGIVNSTGDNFSSVGISGLSEIVPAGMIETEIDISGVMIQRITNLSDRLVLRLYVNQTGSGTLPDLTIYMDDLTVSRLTIPAIPVDLTSLINQVGINTINLESKVNKSGDFVSNPFYLISTDILYDTYGVLQLTPNFADFSVYNITTSTYNSGFKSETSKAYIHYYNFPVYNEFGVNDSGAYSLSDIDMTGKNITHCLNCVTIDSGNYVGNGETNRFIPYNLNNIAKKIDIYSNSSIAQTGTITIPGNILSMNTFFRLPVTPHNNTGFFVSGIYNTGGGNITSTLGNNSSSLNGFDGVILYTPIYISSESTFINMSVSIQTASGNIRFGLYNSSVYYPTYLLNQSGSIPATTGFVTANLSATMPIGTYWLALQFSSNIAVVHYAVTPATTMIEAQAFGVFPTTATASSPQSYIVYQRYSVATSSQSMTG